MAPSATIGLVWFRRDLRIDDNPAWAAATSECDAVVPLFVLDPRLLDTAGPFRRRQLLANLQALDYDLNELADGRLLVRIGDPVELVPQTVQHYGVGNVYWNADVTPFATRRDERVAKELEVPVHTWHGSLVHAPGDVLTRKGALPKAFSAFFKAWQSAERAPWPEPGEAMLLDHPGQPLPALDGPPPLPEGEAEAKRRLALFVERVDRYADDRHRADLDATSMLSADLKFGTLSPRAVVDAVGTGSRGRETFVRQLAYRDWLAHLLAERPELVEVPAKDRFAGVEWRDVPAEVAAWKGGFTGYPIVDAGMRQLRETGLVHHRVRTICASFLARNLLVDWRVGERHFRQVLLDGDVAQNVGNWQSAAGVGVDATPGRVPNIVTQSEKCDPDGEYIRRWVPELARLGHEHIHAPWKAPADELERAGVRLGDDYPEPIVDLSASRDRAVKALQVSDGEAGGGAATG